jgi:hypothetical protein
MWPVADKVGQTQGRISAKRLLPAARAAGYPGSPRNFRRLVASARADWRRGQHRGRRPGVWAPGETLLIDWGVVPGGLHVFCAVLAWSRWRFVRLAGDERAATTLGLLAECFDALGGVPKVVLADRMGCLKGGVVADVVVPTADHVRFAAYYLFRPDFCRAADPQSKGAGGVPGRLRQARPARARRAGRDRGDVLVGARVAPDDDRRAGLVGGHHRAWSGTRRISVVPAATSPPTVFAGRGLREHELAMAPSQQSGRSGQGLGLQGVELGLGDGAGVEQLLGLGDLLGPPRGMRWWRRPP